MTYRSDIDGLRAIAVLLVLFFHCQIVGFGGGYVGVDVFFVISGFLITRIILDDLAAGRFSFRAFYVRRVRRLLPALIATILLTLITAMVIMTPAHLAETATSATFAALSLSNVHFAFSGSYFGAEAEIKPLLHTWSLSVEEQFYLLWPLTLVFLMRFGGRRLVLAAVVLGVPAGLALSEFWVGIDRREAYFLPMFRAFQFLVGAGLVWVVDRRLPRAAEAALFVIGLALVLGSGMFYTDHTPFPGLAALVPTLGAALLLWCGRAQGLSRLLTNAAALWVGRVSYSIYLVHWPIVVFWRYLSVDGFSPADKVAMVALSLAGGAMLYLLVERRFRLRRGDVQAVRWQPMLRTLGLTGATAAAGFGVQIADGLPVRMELAPVRAAYAEASRFHFFDDYDDGALILGAGRSERILIFGDSMMQNYIPALMALPHIADAEVHVVTRGGCAMARDAVLIIGGGTDTVCRDLRDTLYAIPGRFDRVIWTQKWLNGYDWRLRWETPDGPPVRAFPDGQADFADWRDGVARTLDHFAARSDEVVLIGPQVEVEGVNPALRRIGPVAPLDRLEETISELEQVPSPARTKMAEGLRMLAAERPGVRYIDPSALICPDGQCRLAAPPHSYFLDGIHHTTAATPFLSDRFARLLAR